MAQNYEKKLKYEAWETKKMDFSCFFAQILVPLHPLFGVIAGRKYREACYVALERYSIIRKKLKKWI